MLGLTNQLYLQYCVCMFQSYNEFIYLSVQNKECLSVNFKKVRVSDEMNCELNDISSHEIEKITEWSDEDHEIDDRNYREWDFYEIKHPGF